MTRKALGRGLEALIPRAGTAMTPPPPTVGGAAASDHPTAISPATVARGEVAVDRIRPNPWQPRRTSDPIRMDELVRSVQSHGVLEPLLLRKIDDSYELVAGERRLRAAQRAGMTTVPAIIVALDDKSTLEVALIENLQREDLNPVDEARAYHVLAQEFGRTHDEIATQVGKERSTVTNLLRLLKLPPAVLALLEEGKLSVGHARAVLSLPRPHDQEQWAGRIAEHGWSVRETEKRLARILIVRGDQGSQEPVQQQDPHISRVEEAIRRRVGTEVQLCHGKRGGGRLVFLYTDQEELERLLDFLGVQVQ